MDETLIAPCGMNCAICKAHLRAKNPCHGCNFADQNKPKTRVHCKIRTCIKRRGKFCFQCDEFPCERLKHIDERYRTRYDMSEISNLEYLRDHGMDKFIASQRQKYQSAKGTFCVHDKKYY